MTAGQAARRLNVVGSGTVDAIAERAARARVVLIGEASHGTQDFYAMRADVTRRLVTAHGFRAVALEADWPDTSRAHRYVTGRSDDASAMQALADFRRFPAWMWRNEPVREFVDWLADFNRSVEMAERRLVRTRPLQPACVDRGRARVPRSGRSGGGGSRPLALQLLRVFRRLRPGATAMR